MLDQVKVAAGGGVQKTLNRQKKQYKEMLRVIHTTQKVVPHPLAALPEIPEEVRTKVQDALLEIGQSVEGKKLLARIPMKKVGVATMDDYLPLKEMGLERFYIAPQ